MSEIKVSPGAATHEYNFQMWRGMKAGDIGQPYNALDFNRAGFQLCGDSAGIRVTLEGRLHHDAKFMPLEDDDGFPVTLSDRRMAKVSNFNALEIRPVAGSGSEIASFDVIVLLKR